MSDELLRPLNIPAPLRGLYEGLEPSAPEFPDDAAPDLENVRLSRRAWDTRLGFAAWKATGGAGWVNYLARVYRKDGTNYLLAAQGGVLYQQTGSGAFAGASGGTGLGTAPKGNRYQGTTLKDKHYFTDRTGALRSWDPTNGVQTVTQGTAPSVAPSTRRRILGFLDPFSGSVSATPTGWTASDASNFPCVVAELQGGSTDDNVPDFVVATNIVKFTVKTAGSKNDKLTKDRPAGYALNSHWLCFWHQSEQKRALMALEIGVNQAAEFKLAIDPPESGQPYLAVYGLGNLPRIEYLRFRCLRNAGGSNKTTWMGAPVLTGRLQGKYRYRCSYYNPTTGRETSLSPATDFVDCTAIPTINVTTGSDALEKCIELTTGLATLPDVAVLTRVRWYRNGGLADLIKDGRGLDKWLRLATGGMINSTLASGPSAGDTLLTVPTGTGAANLTAGDWVVLDRAVGGKEEFVQVEAAYTAGSPNDTFRVYTALVDLTDLVIDAALNTKITSASYTFDATDVGKTVRVTAGTGFTAGYYTISSVSGGAATLGGAVGTVGSTGGTGKVLTGLTLAHSSGATVTPGYLDNTANESIDTTTNTLPERDDAPSGGHWLAKAPDGRLWMGRTDEKLEYAVSNLPTVDHPYDNEVFPDAVDPTRGSYLQGFRGYLDGEGHGDEITWFGFFNNTATFLTTRACYQCLFTGQQDYRPPVKLWDNLGCIAGETVCEVNGALYWVADGPRVMRWDGRSSPQDVSFQRVNLTLANAPEDYLATWFAQGRADKEGARYDLFMNPTLTQAYTDLVVDGSLNTKVSSVARPFVAADVGRVLTLASGTGFTVGSYSVVSVAAGAATLDRAVGTTSSTGGTGDLHAGNSKLLSYNTVTEAWETHIYYASALPLAWSTSVLLGGPGDAREYYAAHPTSGNVRQLESGLTDNSAAIPIRAKSKRFGLGGAVGRAQHWYGWYVATGADTLTVQIRMSDSEYRNTTDFAATDGDPAQSWNETLADSDTSESEVYQRLLMHRLLGRTAQVILSGSVSNRPSLSRQELRYSVVRKGRVTG